jgi:hypothetical protein
MTHRDLIFGLSCLVTLGGVQACGGKGTPGSGSGGTAPMASPRQADPAKPAPAGPAKEPEDKLADEVLQCPRLVYDRNTKQPIVKMDQYVDLRIEGGTFHMRIRVPEATTDLSFAQCRRVPRPADGAVVPHVLECTTLEGYGGVQFSIDAHLIHLRAQVSRLVSPGTDRHRTLAGITSRVGREVPRRTIAFLVEDRQVMEFLCYP